MSSALKPRGGTRAWQRLRRVVLERDEYRCRIPNDLGEPCLAYADTVDHVVPRARGGGDALANLRAACSACNYARGAGEAPTRREWAW